MGTSIERSSLKFATIIPFGGDRFILGATDKIPSHLDSLEISVGNVCDVVIDSENLRRLIELLKKEGYSISFSGDVELN
jgi:hypothetical protein